MIVQGESVARWVMQTIGSYTEGMAGIGWQIDGEIVAGIAYENYNHNNLFGHQRIDKNPPKSFWIANARYIFNDLGCKRFTATVESTNLKAIKLNHHIGFETEAILKDAGRTGDLVVMVLWKNNCRFLGWK